VHSDTAHWTIPARYVVLHALQVGRGARHTLLVDTRRLAFGVDDRQSMLCGLVFVDFGRHCFPTTILRRDAAFFRFDPGCMRPANGEGRRAMALVAAELGRDAAGDVVEWRPGDTLVIDNWRCLHGRVAGDGAPDPDRILLRLLVKERRHGVVS